MVGEQEAEPARHTPGTQVPNQNRAWCFAHHAHVYVHGRWAAGRDDDEYVLTCHTSPQGSAGSGHV